MLVFHSTPGGLVVAVDEGCARPHRRAACCIVLSAPVWLVAMAGIWLSSRGPVFFTQDRAGRNGRPFRMFKFRTMCVDAEARRQELEQSNEMSGPVFKVKHDPRVFAFGSWLRKLSIDELPQLLNVLRGEMSLVGPRPLPVYEIEKIEKHAQRRRLSVKPGLTCLWQIMGRNRITQLRGLGRARPQIHRQLVALARPRNPVQDARRGAARRGGALKTAVNGSRVVPLVVS